VQARAEVARAQSRLAIEEQEAAVARKEWESAGKGEPTPLALREPQLAEARAAAAAAEAALAQAELDVDRTVVRAPYRGRVREQQAGIGELVQRGQTAARLYSVDVAEVRLPIADEQLAYVRLPLDYRDGEQGRREQGPPVLLTTEFAGLPQEWLGRIVRVEGEIDPETRMIHAIAQVDDPYGWTSGANRPPLAVGMFVRAQITGRNVRAFVLPRTAVRGQDMVLIVNHRERLEFRRLKILRRERDRVLATEGIEEGQLVCTSPLEAAVEGMRVRVFETH
jgi:RND family efflux transporter MFP subunit